MEEVNLKEIESKMYKYLIENDGVDYFFLLNINNFGELCAFLQDKLYELEKIYSIERPLTYDEISKIGILEKIELAKEIFKESGIDVDIESLIQDGTIDFNSFDYYNGQPSEKYKQEKLFDGHAGRKNGVDFIESENNGLITDLPTFVHEVMHYTNHPKKEGEFSLERDIFTEGLSIFMEFISCDKLEELGFSDEAKFVRNERYIVDYHSAVRCERLLKMFYVLREKYNIEKESYEECFKDNNYEKSLEQLVNVQDKLDKLEVWFSYAFGSVIATHMYVEYKKDKEFMKKVIELNSKLNEVEFGEALDIIGLTQSPKENLKFFDKAYDEMASMFLTKRTK